MRGRGLSKALRVLEICAGAGGQALGLERAGFEHLLAIELDQHAANTLKHNRPDWEVAVGDVANGDVWDPALYSPATLGDRLDLLAGGVPCPPFSIAGQQRGAEDERDLFAWAVELVDVIRPRALLLENVRGLSMPRFAAYRQHVIDRLSGFGYRAEWRLLQASDYGVSQLRPRFVLVAMEEASFARFHWPEPQETAPTVGEVLLDLMSSNGWVGASEWARGASKVAPTIVGGSKKHGGPDLGPTRAKRAWAALGVDGGGIANEAPEQGDVFPKGPKLTCEMVARLQGWNDDEFAWEFTGLKTSRYRQIGNAFPPPVAKALGKAIHSALDGTGAIRSMSDNEDVDPFYRLLMKSNTFLSAGQISAGIGMEMTAPEFDRRISLLERDFEIERDVRRSEVVYRLGEFRAFIGQSNHARHNFYEKNVSKVS